MILSSVLHHALLLQMCEIPYNLRQPGSTGSGTAVSVLMQLSMAHMIHLPDFPGLTLYGSSQIPSKTAPLPLKAAVLLKKQVRGIDTLTFCLTFLNFFCSLVWFYLSQFSPPVVLQLC